MLFLLMLPLCFALACLGCSRERKPVLVKPPTLPASRIQLEPITLSALQRVKCFTGADAGELTMLEIIGGGVGATDFDLDGRCDLYFPCGGNIQKETQRIDGVASQLIWNLGEQSSNCAEFARVQAKHLFAHGVTEADYDQDGWPDLLVYGYYGVALYRNMGDGTFFDVTELAGLVDLPWTTSVAWFDADGDGLLDLYGTGYVDWSFENHPKCEGWWGGELEVCPPLKFGPRPDWFFRGKASGNFERLDDTFQREEEGRGLGLLAFKFSSDEPTPSLYVANDMSGNALFNSTGNSAFLDSAALSGVAVDGQGIPNASMGVALMDCDRNAEFDLFVTNFDHETMAIYNGQGDGSFEYGSFRFGLTVEVPPSVAFGVVAPDLDCDGDEDVFFVCGGVEYSPSIGTMDQVPVLLENREGQRFYRITPHPVLEKKEISRGCVVLDWNNDGLPDVTTSSISRSPVLLENRSDTENRWLRLRLIGTGGLRTPIGAIVRIEGTASGTQIRQLHGGGSYLSQSQMELFCGVMNDETVDLKITWPDGNQQRIQGLKTNQAWLITEDGRTLSNLRESSP